MSQEDRSHVDDGTGHSRLTRRRVQIARSERIPALLPRLRRRRRVRVRPISGLSINRMIPNMLTLTALCAGMTAIRLAISGRWQEAVAAVLIAGVLDGLDGRVARLLKSSSTFGAQLDSLSDFICFGVAPGIIVYLWSMSTLRSVGWVTALLFAVCMALRLARFNTQLTLIDPPPYAAKFFTGVPAPAAASLALVPLVCWLEFGEDSLRWPWLCVGTTTLISILMVSQLPTFSLKKIRVPHQFAAPLLVLFSLMVAFLFMEPWPTLLCVALLYIGSMPFSVAAYFRQKRLYEAEEAACPEGYASARAAMTGRR